MSNVEENLNKWKVDQVHWDLLILWNKLIYQVKMKLNTISVVFVIYLSSELKNDFKIQSIDQRLLKKAVQFGSNSTHY